MPNLMTGKALVLTLALAAISPSVLAHPTPNDPTPYVTHELRITGAVQQPLTLTLADLTALPALTVAEADSACPQPGREKRQQDVGIRLRDLLTHIKLTDNTPANWKRMLVIAHASDGYVAVFTWHELFNTVNGNGVVVTHTRNGQPLPASEGLIALVAACDLRTGPRHVKWLQSLELRRLAD